MSARPRPRAGVLSLALRAAHAAARRFFNGYDAGRDSTRRRRVAGILRHEDEELDTTSRRKVLDAARDTQRNFAVAAWAIRKHLDFVAAHTFLAQTPDRGYNTELKAAVKEWGKRENCDVAKRHPLRRMIRLAEARRTVDGDIGFLKLDSGHLQALEGDRVRDPDSSPAGEAWRHGVLTNDAGEALKFAISRRKCGGGFEHERTIDSAQMLWFATYEANHRFDAVRGVSPIVSGLNSLRDVYENFEYALARAKVAQLFGIKFTRDAEDAPGELTSTEQEDEDGVTRTKHEIDFGKGPVTLDLDPGEDAEFLENKTPALEFQQFMQGTIGVALKAIDIPYSFWDEAYTNFFGSRAALLLYLQSAKHKRADVQELLGEWFAWRHNLAIARRELTPPRSLRDKPIAHCWVPDGVPWWLPGQEIEADIRAVGFGVKTRDDVTLAHFGRTFEDTLRLIKQEQDLIRRLGVTLTEAAPQAVAPVADPSETDGEQTGEQTDEQATEKSGEEPAQ